MTTSRRLTSWKEVATYFQRDERTVKRWETLRGLPIHRAPGQARSMIYAYTEELDAWFDASADAPKPAEAAPAPADPQMAPARRRAGPMIGLLAALGVVGAAVAGWGWLSAERAAQAQRPASRDAQVNELYREGWHDWNTRSPAGLSRAQDEFGQAVKKDPNFAPAYVGLANTELLLREYSHVADAAAYPQAEASVRRALALDPDLADAHSALGFIDYWWRWQPGAAEAELRKAIALAPASIDAHLWLANILKVQLRYREALDQIDRAQSLEPESSAVLEAKGDILMSAGQVEAGRKILLHLEEIEPTRMWPHAHLARVALTDQRYSAYLSEARAAADIRGDPDQRALVDQAEQGWRAGGGTGLLARLLDGQRALALAGKAPVYDVACTYALMNRADDAAAWLRRAVAAHDAAVLGTFTDPCFRTMVQAGRLAFLRPIVFGGGPVQSKG